jgi:hypothetical protein
MPYVNFGTKGEPGFELVESPDLIAVRTRSRRPVRGVGPVPRPPTAAVTDGILVATSPRRRGRSVSCVARRAVPRRSEADPTSGHGRAVRWLRAGLSEY